MRVDYEECLQFIESTHNIELYPYQKMILRLMFQNKPFIAARGCGKTAVIRWASEYVTEKFDELWLENNVDFE